MSPVRLRPQAPVTKKLCFCKSDVADVTLVLIIGTKNGPETGAKRRSAAVKCGTAESCAAEVYGAVQAQDNPAGLTFPAV